MERPLWTLLASPLGPPWVTQEMSAGSHSRPSDREACRGRQTGLLLLWQDLFILAPPSQTAHLETSIEERAGAGALTPHSPVSVKEHKQRRNVCEGGQRERERGRERETEREERPGSLLLRIECDVGGEGPTSCGLWLSGAFTSCSLFSRSFWTMLWHRSWRLQWNLHLRLGFVVPVIIQPFWTTPTEHQSTS